MKLRRLNSTDPGFAAALAHLTAFENAQDPAVDEAVAGIVTEVRQRGDAALLEYTRRFDRWQADSAAALELSGARAAGDHSGRGLVCAGRFLDPVHVMVRRGQSDRPACLHVAGPVLEDVDNIHYYS